MTVSPIPDGYPIVSPYLMVKDAARFIDFMGGVFDAKLVRQIRQPDGKIGHTELRIGDSLIMLAEAHEPHAPTPIMLHFYVQDVDAIFARAIAAGATAVSPPTDQFYGDRSGGVTEPTGNTLWISTHIEDVSPDELQRRAARR
jgi:PhnB protein